MKNFLLWALTIAVAVFVGVPLLWAFGVILVSGWMLVLGLEH